MLTRRKGLDEGLVPVELQSSTVIQKAGCLLVPIPARIVVEWTIEVRPVSSAHCEGGRR